MEVTLYFESHPTIEGLKEELKNLQPPYSVEIRQNPIHEFLDCDTVEELHAFMCTGDYAVNDDEDFVVEVEEINPPPDDDRDHPSLTAAERNPSMVNQL
jgi:hypothetical protein